MRRYQRYTVLFAALAVTGCLLACGGGASGQKPAESPAKTAEAAGTEEKETVFESGEKKESAGAPMAQKKSGSGDCCRFALRRHGHVHTRRFLYDDL